MSLIRNYDTIKVYITVGNETVRIKSLRCQLTFIFLKLLDHISIVSLGRKYSMATTIAGKTVGPIGLGFVDR
jgi:hypothetical protein